jgi:hypothetical protein
MCPPSRFGAFVDKESEKSKGPGAVTGAWIERDMRVRGRGQAALDLI